MLGRLAELFFFGLAPLMLGGLLMPGAVAAEEVAITGEVSYRERMALPPNAVLTVRLLDVSLADAPETYYVTDYYRPYPIVLARLSHLDAAALHDLLSVSHRLTLRRRGP